MAEKRKVSHISEIVPEALKEVEDKRRLRDISTVKSDKEITRLAQEDAEELLKEQKKKVTSAVTIYES